MSELLTRLQPKIPERPLIRLGPRGDGGYLIPDDTDGVRYAFSPGVDRESGFEADLAARGIDVFMADASVNAPAQPNPRFHFIKKYIGSYSNERQLTLGEWVNGSIGDVSDDLILQMDIEGAEYEVILNSSPELLRRFRIIVLELHELGRLFERDRFPVFLAFFDRLLAIHNVVHLHPNNYCAPLVVGGLEVPHFMEVTLYRKDRPVGEPYPGPYPHPLDVDNVPGRVAVPLTWFK